jgi:cell fate regulator YaaT (PSP1 superfamily)
MYKTIRSQLPKIGKTVKTLSGEGQVVRYNAISSRIAIRLDGGREIEAGLDEIIKDDK